MDAEMVRDMAAWMERNPGLVRIAEVLSDPNTPVRVREELRADMGLPLTPRPMQTYGLFQLRPYDPPAWTPRGSSPFVKP